MASFFKRGKKIVLTVEKDELKDGGGRLLSALKEASPIEGGMDIQLNMTACERVSIEAVSVLSSFSREARKAGCNLHVTTGAAVHDQFAVAGLDRHFTLIRAEPKGA